MSWNNLSNEQKAFLTKYLASGFMDLFRDRNERQENIEKTAKFEEFIALEALFATTAATVPDDYPEKSWINATAAEASAMRDAGRFDEAVRTLDDAIKELNEHRTVVESEAIALRQEAAAPLPTDGLLADETEWLEVLQGEAEALLADACPNRADLDAARIKVAELKSATDEVKAATAERIASREKLVLARQAVGPALDFMAEIDLSTFDATDDSLVLFTAVQRAISVQSASIEAELSDDIVVHQAAIQLLTDWQSEADAARLEYDAAVARQQERKDVTEALEQAFENARDELEYAAGIDPDDYLPAKSYDALERETIRVKAVLHEAETAITSTDLAIKRQSTQRLIEWKTTFEPVLLEAYRVALAYQKQREAEAKESWDAYEKSLAEVQDALDKTAALDLDAVSQAQNFPQIEAAVNAALAILALVADASASDETSDHEEATRQIEAWKPDMQLAQEQYVIAVDHLFAWETFQIALGKVTADLNRAAGIDPTPLANAGNYGALVAAVDRANALLAEVTAAGNSWDMDVHKAATANIEAWKAESQLAQQEYDSAVESIAVWEDCRVAIDDIRAYLDWSASIDPGPLKMAANHAALVTAVDKAKALKSEVDAAASSWDMALHKAATEKALAWKAEETVAEEERAKAQTEVTALSEARVTEKLAAFKLPSGGAVETSAKAALEYIETVLNAEPVTDQVVADAKAATENAGDALDALYGKTPAATAEELSKAKADYQAAKKKSDAVLAFQALTTNLSPGGALTATSPMTLDDASRAKFVEGLARAPAMAGPALDACKNSRHAKAVADKIGPFADLLDKGVAGNGGFRYGDPAAAVDHARQLLEQGAFRGEDYLDGALAYVDGKWPLSDRSMDVANGDFISRPGKTDEVLYVQIATRRGAAVADKLLASGDPYDLRPATVAAVLGDLNYGSSALNGATPIHTLQVEATIETLKTPEAMEMFRSAKPPKGNGLTLAIQMMKQIHGDTWTLPDPITPEESAKITKQALLIAMFNPIEQGSVGSCFATAGLITLRQENPERAMKIYKQALEEGTFTPLKQNGDILDPPPIPLVLEFTKGDNPITRSIEYTAATAGSAVAQTVKSTVCNESIGKAFDEGSVITGLQDIAGDGLFWTFDVMMARAALSGAVSYKYDATAEQAEKSADGNSHFGCFVASVGGTVIHDADFDAGKTKFIDAACAVIKTVWADKLNTPEALAKLRAIIASDDFTKGFKQDKSAIWQLGSGGHTDEVDNVLLDKDIQTTVLVDASADPTATTESARTLNVVSGLMGQFAGKTGNVSLSNDGIHAFNGLPDHPSQAAIKGKTKAEMGVIFAAMGTGVTSLELPKEQAVKIYDDALAWALKSVPEDLKSAAKAQLDAKRPGVAMKTPGINTAVTDGKNAMWTAVEAALTEAHVNTWALTQGTALDGKSDAEKKTAYVADLKKSPTTDSIRAVMAAAIPMPDPIVIADTNWGGGTHHQFFAIAPDPATGEPIMWTKTDPPGSMEPAGEKWVKPNWRVTGK